MPAPCPLILELDPPPGTRVRVLSDLHLAHERSEAPTPEQLLRLMQGVDILVIAGDLAESRESQWQESGLSMREGLQALCRQNGVTLIPLAGNHDPDAGPLLLKLWGGKVAIMHGHALYKQGSPWGWEYLMHKDIFHACVARYPNCNSSLTERLELSAEICQLTVPIMQRHDKVSNRHLRSLLHCFYPPQRPLAIVWSWLTCGWRSNAFAERFFPEAEVVILGHFHRSGRWQYGKRTIVNTGAWYKHATPYVADLQDGRLVSYRRAQG